MSKDLLRSYIQPSANSFIRMIDATINVLYKEKRTGHIIGGKISGGFANLHIPENLVIVGDIHGDLKSFCQILQEIDFERFLANPNNKIIFLGDYIDRGSNSIGILYIICYLKNNYPNSVVLMRGNHEAPVEFPFSSHDLPFKIAEDYGKELGNLIYNDKILTLFRLLILATLIQNQLFLVHGGVPIKDRNVATNFRRLIASAYENHIYDNTMQEILWNDPRQIQNSHNWEYSRRGIGKHFGMNISRKWLRMTGTKVIVRGHEPCQGFKIDHNGMVVTLFSCREPYPNFTAAYISLSYHQLQSVKDGIDLAFFITKI